MAASLDALTRSLAGSYRVEREVGHGGMATVFLAEDLKHHRTVALKVMKPDVAAALGQARFLREIHIVARLAHPNIVPLYDSGVADGHLWYVMPYLEGETLRARIDRERQLPLDDALRLAREIAAALGHAHQHHVVHRDIKPENVLLSDGIARVADFGIARAAGGEAGATTTGVTLGTPAYMAPEQIAGSPDVDGRADLYSLGCVVYEMLAGVPPFVGPVESLAYQHTCVAPRPVTDIRPGVPEGVAAAIARALSKSPADRYVTAARFVEGLMAGAVAVPRATTEAVAVPNNLPLERTRFIGRERERAECEQALERTRLLTLTGIGGGGKTRLALHVAARALAKYPDGVWFVDLGPLGADERVVESVASALGVRETPGAGLVDAVAHHVRDRRLLVVLDNCEHLLTPCAALADAMLRAGAGVRILATSREGLGVEGERIVAVRSMSVPEASAAVDRGAVEASDAVRLFVDRARLADDAFALTDANARAVADVCRRLDGIPLAIELAAARVRVLSVEQILARLDDRFRLLTGGSKTVLPRHQTLRATMQWSYDQMAPDEQRMWRVLSVFAGGATLESAARVFGGDADELGVLDLLTHLADKSTLTVDRGAAGEPRYRLLETVRQFGQERLSETGEADAVRLRHLDEFQSLADRAYAGRFEREEAWGMRLEQEHDNLRAALEVARSADPERYLALAGTLSWFWLARSHLIEGSEHLTAALAGAPREPARPACARALWGAAHLLTWQGDPAAARRWMNEALEVWRRLDDRHEVALALEGIGWAQFLANEVREARDTFDECLRLQLERGDPAQVNRARVAVCQVRVALGDVEAARATAAEVIAWSTAHGDRRSEHFGWHFRADCALIEGTCEASLDLYRTSLELARAIGDRLETSFEIQGVAMSMAGLGRHAEALRLDAAAQAEWERIGAVVDIRFWNALRERYLGAARAAAGPEAARYLREGAGIAFDDAIARALDRAAE